MSHSLPSYLLTLRKRSGLSQADLALLMGISASALCRLETQTRRPSLEFAIATEVILGQRLKNVFPAAYESVQHRIVERAQRLRDRYRSNPKLEGRAGLQVLDDIVERMGQTTLGL